MLFFLKEHDDDYDYDCDCDYNGDEVEDDDDRGGARRTEIHFSNDDDWASEREKERKKRGGIGIHRNGEIGKREGHGTRQPRSTNLLPPRRADQFDKSASSRS